MPREVEFPYKQALIEATDTFNVIYRLDGHFLMLEPGERFELSGCQKFYAGIFLLENSELILSCRVGSIFYPVLLLSMDVRAKISYKPGGGLFFADYTLPEILLEDEKNSRVAEAIKVGCKAPQGIKWLHYVRPPEAFEKWIERNYSKCSMFLDEKPKLEAEMRSYTHISYMAYLLEIAGVSFYNNALRCVDTPFDRGFGSYEEVETVVTGLHTQEESHQ